MGEKEVLAELRKQYDPEAAKARLSANANRVEQILRSQPLRINSQIKEVK